MQKSLSENLYPAMGADYQSNTHAFGGVLNFAIKLEYKF